MPSASLIAIPQQITRITPGRRQQQWHPSAASTPAAVALSALWRLCASTVIKWPARLRRSRLPSLPRAKEVTADRARHRISHVQLLHFALLANPW